MCLIKRWAPADQRGTNERTRGLTRRIQGRARRRTQLRNIKAAESNSYNSDFRVWSSQRKILSSLFGRFIHTLLKVPLLLLLSLILNLQLGFHSNCNCNRTFHSEFDRQEIMNRLVLDGWKFWTFEWYRLGKYFWTLFVSIGVKKWGWNKPWRAWMRFLVLRSICCRKLNLGHLVIFCSYLSSLCVFVL